MLHFLIVGLFVTLTCAAGAFSSDWSNEFDYATHIDEDQLFKLYWTADVSGHENIIEIGIEVTATGWIALGISPRGTMPNSDIAISWVQDGEVFLQDRHTEGRSAPLYDDDQQNLELIEGEEVDGMTRVRFRRTKYLCSASEGHDLSLGDGTTRLIWALHATEDPSQEMWDADSISFHTHYGSQSINFESGVPDHAELPQDIQHLDITMDAVAVPATETTYWCQMMRLPELERNGTRYLRRVEAVIEEGHEALVHHIVGYSCVPDDDVTDDGWAGVCTDPNMPSKHCRFSNTFFVWAVGGNDWDFPADTHLVLEAEWIMLELHYDNPELHADYVDSSGMRMYWSKTPQATEVGIGGVALPAFLDGLAQWIPGGLPRAHNAAFMPAVCTGSLPEEGIKVFATYLHAHTIGASLSLRHIRDGVELAPLDSNMDYDFNYQQYIYLEEPRTILPGDELIVDCWYDSSDRANVTVGGESSRKEMCVAGFLYYPAIDGGVGGGAMKSADALMQWASDAKHEGYLTGDVDAIGDVTIDEFGYAHGFPDLQYDSSADGAAEFYERLWSTQYPQYNKHSVFCADTFLEDEPRFDGFEAYVAPSYCDESDEPISESIAWTAVVAVAVGIFSCLCLSMLAVWLWRRRSQTSGAVSTLSSPLSEDDAVGGDDDGDKTEGEQLVSVKTDNTAVEV